MVTRKGPPTYHQVCRYLGLDSPDSRTVRRKCLLFFYKAPTLCCSVEAAWTDQETPMDFIPSAIMLGIRLFGEGINIQQGKNIKCLQLCLSSPVSQVDWPLLPMSPFCSTAAAAESKSPAAGVAMARPAAMCRDPVFEGRGLICSCMHHRPDSPICWGSSCELLGCSSRAVVQEGSRASVFPRPPLYNACTAALQRPPPLALKSAKRFQGELPDSETVQELLKACSELGTGQGEQ